MCAVDRLLGAGSFCGGALLLLLLLCSRCRLIGLIAVRSCCRRDCKVDVGGGDLFKRRRASSCPSSKRGWLRTAVTTAIEDVQKRYLGLPTFFHNPNALVGRLCPCRYQNVVKLILLQSFAADPPHSLTRHGYRTGMGGAECYRLPVSPSQAAAVSGSRGVRAGAEDPNPRPTHPRPYVMQNSLCCCRCFSREDLDAIRREHCCHVLSK